MADSGISLVVFAVAVAACVFLWRTRPVGLAVVPAALLTLVGAGAVVVAWCDAPQVREPSPSAPLVAAAHGYVGSASCRACHPSEHSSWHASFHRTMTQPATRASLAVSFEQLTLDWFGAPVELQWRGDVLWTKFTRTGNRPAPVLRPVEQVTGSHHLQVLWYSTGMERELAPVPMVFHLEQQRWLPLSSVFVLPPEYRDPPEPGAWNVNCQMCHATHVRPRVDVGRADTEVSELGVACEACHGPGGKHVAAHQEPVARYFARHDDQRDQTIVEPRQLGAARSAQVCGQCHSVNLLRSAHHEHWRQEGLVYRPGGDLQASLLIVDPTLRYADELRSTLQHNPNFFASAFWPDGEVRLSGREYNGLLRSPCYTQGHAERQLDCTSCHSLHGSGEGWRDDQLKPGMRGDAACTQCHSELADAATAAAHAHHPAETVTCMDCHMPHTSIGLLKTERSHTITAPRVQVELATGRPNACNLCHLDQTLGWTQQHLQQWFAQPLSELDAEQQTTAAGVRWLLTGDAGQRVIAAWHFGWAPAMRAAQADWQAPFLARLLDDPYYAVRFSAARSLRTVVGSTALADYDFVASAAVARGFGERATAAWEKSFRGPARPALLLTEQGLAAPEFARLYARRNNRPVYIAE